MELWVQTRPTRVMLPSRQDDGNIRAPALACVVARGVVDVVSVLQHKKGRGGEKRRKEKGGKKGEKQGTMKKSEKRGGGKRKKKEKKK